MTPDQVLKAIEQAHMRLLGREMTLPEYVAAVEAALRAWRGLLT